MGFEQFDIATSDGRIHGRVGGVGPPLLLLHGIPETHLMWRHVAPVLADRFTVVATDLRGFGDSGSPAAEPDHRPHSMRAIAAEQVEVMIGLGFEEFAVAGHDRGGRCAYRMALDHPGRITRLAVLDVAPTGEAFRRADKDFALGFWVWSFLAAPAPVPERLIAGDPELFVNHLLDSWADDPTVFDATIRAEYIAKFRNPTSVAAICEEYRAAATLDCEHDEADRGKRRIDCPVLTLWSATGAIAAWYDPIAIWHSWTQEVTGAALGCGHFLPEEAPEQTAARLIEFFG